MSHPRSVSSTLQLWRLSDFLAPAHWIYWRFMVCHFNKPFNTWGDRGQAITRRVGWVQRNMCHTWEKPEPYLLEWYKLASDKNDSLVRFHWNSPSEWADEVHQRAGWPTCVRWKPLTPSWQGSPSALLQSAPYSRTVLKCWDWPSPFYKLYQTA